MFRRKSNDSETPAQEAPRRESAMPVQAPSREAGRKATKEIFTIIYRGTTVSGDIHAEGRVRVYGTVRGNVHVDGTLEVAESGYVEGDTIEVQVIKVIGRVRGNVIADGKVEIWKGGVLEGDVKAAALDIEEGAAFTGRSEMRAAPAALPEALGAAAGAGKDAGRDAGDDVGNAALEATPRVRDPVGSDRDGGGDGVSAAASGPSDDDFGDAFREDATARK